MKFVGVVVCLLALILLLSFRSLLHQQVLVGEGEAAEESRRRRDDRKRNGREHAKLWAEERKRMRWFMTRDYACVRRHTPRNNRMDP